MECLRFRVKGIDFQHRRHAERSAVGCDHDVTNERQLAAAAQRQAVDGRAGSSEIMKEIIGRNLGLDERKLKRCPYTANSMHQ